MATTVSDAVLAAAPADAAPDAPATPIQRRWQILQVQLRGGHEPCFGTEARHRCAERETCEFRLECLSLRASWRR